MVLVGGDQIQFQYQAGNGLLGVSVETSYKLNNDQWHSVHVERNRKVRLGHETVPFFETCIIVCSLYAPKGWVLQQSTSSINNVCFNDYRKLVL